MEYCYDLHICMSIKFIVTVPLITVLVSIISVLLSVFIFMILSTTTSMNVISEVPLMIDFISIVISDKFSSARYNCIGM